MPFQIGEIIDLGWSWRSVLLQEQYRLSSLANCLPDITAVMSLIKNVSLHWLYCVTSLLLLICYVSVQS